jgi:small subunit ribosomal protein S4
MIIGPKYKIARRLGAPVFEKTQTQKYTLSQGRKEKRGRGGPRQKTDFGVQMNEKQKARFSYLLTEKQFSNYVKKALATRGTDNVGTLYEMLERRLDNTVLRAGFAHARGLARQMVSHNHIQVNGRTVNVPSFKVSLGDVITVREGSSKKPLFAGLEERLQAKTAPSWIKVDAAKKRAEIQGAPKAEKGELLFDLNSVIEFYSR